ncbi:MAG: aldehyde ferredoxin oxidoreductase family protein [Desulfobacterales bacterium]|jgi:aldehyde:ferredoxin oxidoreductase|nr:aldehyde ferredoxin oxidoreductase family protein [Desulfobacterales bacterium]
MPFGYTGKILHVDLTHRKIETEEPGEVFYRSYLGGRGIGYHYLMRDMPARADALSPENVFTLATGVMTGVPIAASCRFAAVGKSPLTGTAGESEAAGFFGPELKKAGFDAVVFRGRSEAPVYLWVTEGRAEIRDARAMAEQGSREVEDAIRSELGSDKIRVAQTGLAGMKRVRFANITNNLGHFNGRNGFGAVMGSKNLRAVAALGAGELELHDPDFLRKTATDYAKTFRKSPAGDALYTYGTTVFPEPLSAAGGLPVNNFRGSALADASIIGGDRYNTLLLKKRKGCHACPIMCKRVIALDDPVYGVDSRYGGPEYETIAALGSNLNILDLKAVAKGNEICDRYCMDTISAGMTIAFACECFEKGVISAADTGGLELRFGDPLLMLKLLEMTARREGFGDLLAEGSARLASRWGVAGADYCLCVKGQELALHDPRIKVGVGMSYALCTYGADHMNTPHDPSFVDPNSFAFKSVNALGIYRAMPATQLSNDKVRSFVILENFWRMLDSLGLCVFGFAPRGVMPLETMVASIKAATGWEVSLHDLMASAERSSMLARAFNSREGFSIKDDRLPGRLFDPKPNGPNAGTRIFSEEEFNAALEKYYAVIGCDPETGRPSKGKLLEMNLEWVEELLASRGIDPRTEV